ncbi:MAG: protein BatD [Bacteroidia bacterium]|nr:MAG: protein BatD [Bacteroidia bacterium]
MQRFLLYPQRSGTIEIDQASLTVLVQEKLKSNDPFFGDFFSTFNTIPRVISSMPVKIEVLPLPPGEPSSFTGTVGNIKVKSEIDKDTLAINEALTYRITISGNGNLKLAGAPEISVSPDIEIYEPKTLSDLKTSISGTEGTMKFEYILIPRYHGSFKIPSYQFSYFEPDSRTYRTAETGEMEFYVTKSDKGEKANEVYGGVSREDITYLGRDIRYINTSVPKFRSKSESLVSGSAIYMLFASVLALFCLVIIFRREQVKRNSDLARVRNRRAGRIARSRLKTAAGYMKENDPHLFYSEILKAIWGYLGDKLDIPVSKFNREFALRILSEKGMEQEIVDLAGELIDKCEYSRYSPAGNDMSPAGVYQMAERVIREIENNI